MTAANMDKPLPAYGDEVESACGGPLLFTQHTPHAVYRGKRVYFCLSACKQTFEKAPDDFMTGRIPHFDELA